jgi:hypothetical protein
MLDRLEGKAVSLPARERRLQAEAVAPSATTPPLLHHPVRPLRRHVVSGLWLSLLLTVDTLLSSIFMPG